MTQKIEIPTVETERLILREYRLPDFEAYAALWRDPLVTRFIGGRPRTREENQAILDRLGLAGPFWALA